MPFNLGIGELLLVMVIFLLVFGALFTLYAAASLLDTIPVGRGRSCDSE